MEYEEDARTFNFVSGLVCGIAIGAGVALLIAPESGRRTRRRITRRAGHLREDASGRWEDIADEVRGRVDDALSGARKRFS